MMLADKLNNFRLILASSSPRRQQLLKDLGLKFEVRFQDYDEIYPDDLKGEEISLYVAREKAATIMDEMASDEIGITADTIVWCNNKILGKPDCYDDAILILREISGNTHEVITGVCIFSKTREITFSVSTRVKFETMSDEEIHYYVDSYKPYDKAGAYGIQEWIGLAACSYIEGSYSNVVGLPVQRLYKELQNFIRDEG